MAGKISRFAKRPVVGWREYVKLPQLGIGKFIAKIDTGAKTAALHAENIDISGSGQRKTVNFVVAINGRHHHCQLPLAGQRRVKNSSGASELRVVVETEIQLGKRLITAEVTLTNRTDMGVPMLLGRATVRDHFLVHPGRSFLISAPKTAKKPRP
ncbi:MAG: RimK/LysX family protein [Hyphomicrobiales bacterium]